MRVRWPSVLLAGLFSVVALSLMPASARAQSAEDCRASLTTTEDPARADFDVACRNRVRNVIGQSNEPGDASGRNLVASCDRLSAQRFRCEPSVSCDFFGCTFYGFVSGSFRAKNGDVCGSPALAITFVVKADANPFGSNTRTEKIGPVRVSGCPPGPLCTSRGTSGNDILRGTSGDDVICGGAGNDIVYGGGGNDTLRGGSGNDILRGQGGNDHTFGGPGNDILYGGSGSDRLFGEDGRDILKARDEVGGNDLADAGAGEDSCASDRGDTRESC